MRRTLRTRRTRRTRRALGTLGLLLLLAGCGDDEAQRPAAPPSADVEPPAVTIVSGTAAGGEASGRVTVLDGPAAVAAYAEQFSGPLARTVQRAAEGIEVPAGGRLVAGVVAVGCDVPREVGVAGTGEDVRFTVGKVPSPHAECFAPVTTVALAALSQDGGE